MKRHAVRAVRRVRLLIMIIVEARISLTNCVASYSFVIDIIEGL